MRCMYACSSVFWIFFYSKNPNKSEKYKKKKIFFLDFLSVSESVSVHGIQDLSAGRTRTVRVRYAHPHSAGFLDH